ncbi:hypothetical protein BJF85_18525 [Saccharomonospora sp. CUA-673]|uniref:hypothetical protein n=1 Tax=Saccharomonospora sp. CUA-673 TaxID=1904969 RepID=UPI00095BDF87|nr:hypothetical protein [Saccharomonospora sp. CUA-673]OLT45482.1 hypothetical protein BJF85_18525 [Saccharomonospora sp. CUA-673]
MTRRVAKPAAVTTAGVLLAMTAGAVAPAQAHAEGETKKVRCGQTVTAEPGDRIQGITALGVPLDLGVVTDTVGSLLSGLCKVTVNVVDTAVKPIPGAGEPLSDGLNNTVEGVTGGARQMTDSLGNGQVVPRPDEPSEPSEPEPSEPAPSEPDSGAGDGGDSGSGSGGSDGTREPNSPVVGDGGSGSGGGLSYAAGGSAGDPALRYAGVPAADGALFSAAPGLRYGGQIPGYSPDFGLLGETPPSPNAGVPDIRALEQQTPGQSTGHGQQQGADEVRNAGEASSLAQQSPAGGPSLPLMLAVFALAGVSAGLARSWVLQRAGGS